MTRFKLICTRGGAATTTTRSSTTKLETRCSSRILATAICVRDNGLLPAAVRPCLRFTNAFGELRASTASLRQREGENSTPFMLFVLSLDFGSVFGREDDAGRVHGLLPIHNLDLGRAQKASFCWRALAKAARPSVTISFSCNFRGAISLLPLP